MLCYIEEKSRRSWWNKFANTTGLKERLDIGGQEVLLQWYVTIWHYVHSDLITSRSFNNFTSAALQLLLSSLDLKAVNLIH